MCTVYCVGFKKEKRGILIWEEKLPADSGIYLSSLVTWKGGKGVEEDRKILHDKFFFIFFLNHSVNKIIIHILDKVNQDYLSFNKRSIRPRLHFK